MMAVGLGGREWTQVAQVTADGGKVVAKIGET